MYISVCVSVFHLKTKCLCTISVFVGQDYDKIESHEMTLFEKAAMEQYMVKREAKKATDTPAIPDR